MHYLQYALGWGNGAPIPDFPRPRPRILGTGRGRGQGLEKFWGFFGDEGRLNFEFFWGFIPENPQNIFGEILGMGISLTLGIFEFFPRKNSNFGESPKIPILLMNT